MAKSGWQVRRWPKIQCHIFSLLEKPPRVWVTSHRAGGVFCGDASCWPRRSLLWISQTAVDVLFWSLLQNWRWTCWRTWFTRFTAICRQRSTVKLILLCTPNPCKFAILVKQRPCGGSISFVFPSSKRELVNGRKCYESMNDTII